MESAGRKLRCYALASRLSALTSLLALGLGVGVTARSLERLSQQLSGPQLLPFPEIEKIIELMKQHVLYMKAGCGIAALAGIAGVVFAILLLLEKRSLARNYVAREVQG